MVLARAAKLAVFYPKNGHNSARNKCHHCGFFFELTSLENQFKISEKLTWQRSVCHLLMESDTRLFVRTKNLCTEFQKGGPFPIEAYVTRNCSVCHLRTESDLKWSCDKIILRTEFPGGGPNSMVGIITHNLR